MPVANDEFSVSCRLPQTPKTPTSVAAHYFDEVFAARRKSNELASPKAARRSSLRSIGSRSDIAVEESNGDGDEEKGKRPRLNTNAIGYFDQEALNRLKDADNHLAHHVSNQLEKLKRADSVSTIHDEFEAQLDGS